VTGRTFGFWRAQSHCPLLLFAGLIFCFFRLRGTARNLRFHCDCLLGLDELCAIPDVRPAPGSLQTIAKETGFHQRRPVENDEHNVISGVFIKGVNLANYLDQNTSRARIMTARGIRRDS